MKQGSSYQIQVFSADLENEIRRLKAQVDLFWEKELRLFKAFGLCDGMKILECGSGPGHVLEKLLAAFPASRVTGLEIDRFLVRRSAEILSAFQGDRVHVVEQSIMDIDFPDSTFDFVISRLVLEHLPDPLGAVREVNRVLKVGGKAVFIDNDFDMHLRSYPDIPELADLYEAYCRCRTAEGGNPRIGRELPGLLQEGGFTGVDLEIVCAHSRIIGDEAFLKSEGSGIPAQLVKDGYLARETLDILARKWHDALKRKHHVFFRQLFVAIGEKNAGGEGRPAAELLPEIPTEPSAGVREILDAEPGAQRRRSIRRYLCDNLAVSMKAEPDQIQEDQPLIGLGVDSLVSVELANLISRDFPIGISVIDILEAASLSSLADQMDDELDRRGNPTGKGDGTARAKGSGEPANKSDDWEDGEI